MSMLACAPFLPRQKCEASVCNATSKKQQRGICVGTPPEAFGDLLLAATTLFLPPASHTRARCSEGVFRAVARPGGAPARAEIALS